MGTRTLFGALKLTIIYYVKVECRVKKTHKFLVNILIFLGLIFEFIYEYRGRIFTMKKCFYFVNTVFDHACFSLLKSLRTEVQIIDIISKIIIWHPLDDSFKRIVNEWLKIYYSILICVFTLLSCKILKAVYFWVESGVQSVLSLAHKKIHFDYWAVNHGRRILDFIPSGWLSLPEKYSPCTFV